MGSRALQTGGDEPAAGEHIAPGQRLLSPLGLRHWEHRPPQPEPHHLAQDLG